MLVTALWFPIVAALVARIGHAFTDRSRRRSDPGRQGPRSAASWDRHGSEPATDAPLSVMGHLELAGLLGAVPTDDLSGAERRMSAVHVAAELTLVPVLVGSLGELALNPSVEGVSHAVFPSLGAVRLGGS